MSDTRAPELVDLVRVTLLRLPIVGVFAAIAVWTLLSGGPLGVDGIIFIICFVFALIGFVPMARQVLRPPQQ